MSLVMLISTITRSYSNSDPVFSVLNYAHSPLVSIRAHILQRQMFVFSTLSHSISCQCELHVVIMCRLENWIVPPPPMKPWNPFHTCVFRISSIKSCSESKKKLHRSFLFKFRKHLFTTVTLVRYSQRWLLMETNQGLFFNTEKLRSESEKTKFCN